MIFLKAMAAAIALAMVVGCEGQANTAPTVSLQDRIRRIQADPNMPAPAKAAAIEQIRAHTGKPGR